MLFPRILSLLTPDFKIRYIANALGLSTAEVDALDGFLGRISTNPMLASFTGGQKLSLGALVTFAKDGGAVKSVAQALPALRKLVADPVSARAVADMVVAYATADEAGETLLSLLERVSHLPIVGFSDVEHDGPADFLARAVLPLVAKTADEMEPGEVIQGAQFACRECSHVDHIVPPAHDTFVHTCTECGFVQLVHQFKE